MRLASDKQLRLIEKMERLLEIKFNGSTIREASEFISRHMDAFKNKQAFVYEMTHNLNNY